MVYFDLPEMSVTDSAGNIQMSVTAQCEERNGQCEERNGQCGERNGLDLLGLIIMKLLGACNKLHAPSSFFRMQFKLYNRATTICKSLIRMG